MLHTIHTSSACLNHFIFRGFYETYAGEYLGFVDPNHYDEAQEEIGKLYCQHLSEALWDVLPSDFSDDYEVKYEGMYSPRFYNFETDSVNFELSFSHDLHVWMHTYAFENKEAFGKFLADNYTSRDGFFSYTANNYSDWDEGFCTNDFRCVSALLCFMIDSKLDVDSYNYAFDEAVMYLITENYIDSQYAVHYESGFTAVVIADYDDDFGDYFDCWLLDADNNVVNYMRYDDEYCELNFSAYAAFENVECDLIGKYGLFNNSYRKEQCDVPEFDMTQKIVKE